MDVTTYSSMGPLTSVPEAEPCAAELAAMQDMAAEGWTAGDAFEPIHVSLLELVEAVSEVANGETEVVATVAHMLSSGSVVIRGMRRHDALANLLAAC